jgi:hypothetical protein
MQLSDIVAVGEGGLRRMEKEGGMGDKQKRGVQF